MAVLPRPASPRALLADLRGLWAGDRRHKLVGMVVAVGMTSLIITGFIVEARHGILPEGQQITYAADYAATRTDAEIIAQQKVDQRAKDAALAEKRRAFQRVDKALDGMGL
jgi:hypothetical protein